MFLTRSTRLNLIYKIEDELIKIVTKNCLKIYWKWNFIDFKESSEILFCKFIGKCSFFVIIFFDYLCKNFSQIWLYFPKLFIDVESSFTPCHQCLTILKVKLLIEVANLCHLKMYLKQLFPQYCYQQRCRKYTSGEKK